MLTNIQPNETKPRLAELAMVSLAVLAAGALHAQTFQLANSNPPASAGAFPVSNTDGPGPYLVDPLAPYEIPTDMLHTKSAVITSYKASGSGGTLTIVEHYPDALNCPAAPVTTTYNWAFSPNVISVSKGQQITVTFSLIQPKSCHLGYPPNNDTAANMGMVQAGAGGFDSSSWANYYVVPPTGTANPNTRTLTFSPSGGPTASFIIMLWSAMPVEVVYPYSEVSSTPATEIASWAATQPGFGAAIATTFESYPAGNESLGVPTSGWALYSLNFEYVGGREVMVFMANLNSSPNTRYMLYFDPLTGQWVGWLEWTVA